MTSDQEKMTAKPSKYPQKYFKEKECRECGTKFKPQAPSHHYCSSECGKKGKTSAYLKRNYGIDLDTYYGLLRVQDNKCGICKGEGFTMAKHHELKLVVDHDHETGKVRGLLCHNCNRALGLLKDDKKALLRAIVWVEE